MSTEWKKACTNSLVHYNSTFIFETNGGRRVENQNQRWRCLGIGAVSIEIQTFNHEGERAGAGRENEVIYVR